MAEIAKSLDLSQPPPSNAYISYMCNTLQIEIHTDTPCPSQKRLNLVYSNIMRLFLLAHNGVKYMVTYLDDNTQKSEISLFKQKSEVFEIYQSYFVGNKIDKLHNHCLQIAK